MSDGQQLDLQFKAPPVSVAEVDGVCDWLRGKGWIHRGPLARELGLTIRKLRAIAEHSDGRILSAPGSHGYRLNDDTVTKEEVLRVVAQHKSQRDRHDHRAAAILRRWHRHAQG